MNKTLIIIPTYNEKDNISLIVSKISGYDILFVDDNSPDGTVLEIERLMMENTHINVLKRPSKMGLGSAYIEGIKYALYHKYEKLMTMDADLSHPLDKIDELDKTEYDFVVGSRYVTGGLISGWPWYRYFLSKAANLYAAAILNIGISDMTSGFNCIKTEIIRQIDIDAIKSEGYSFLIELKVRACKKGSSILEVPIHFKERVKGSSKISKSIIFEAIFMVLKLRFCY